MLRLATYSIRRPRLSLALFCTVAVALFVSVAISVPFILSGLINLRQVGFGIAVAVLLDTFLVRPVLLPAAVKLLGRRGWWPTLPQGDPRRWPRTESAVTADGAPVSPA